MRSPQHQLTVGGYFWLHVLLVQTWVDAPKSSFQHLFCILMENAQPNFSPNLDRWWKIMMNDGLFHGLFHDIFMTIGPISLTICSHHPTPGAVQKFCCAPTDEEALYSAGSLSLARGAVGQWRFQRWVLDVGLTYVAYHGLIWLNMWYVICDNMFNSTIWWLDNLKKNDGLCLTQLLYSDMWWWSQVAWSWVATGSLTQISGTSLFLMLRYWLCKLAMTDQNPSKSILCK